MSNNMRRWISGFLVFIGGIFTGLCVMEITTILRADGQDKKAIPLALNAKIIPAEHEEKVRAADNLLVIGKELHMRTYYLHCRFIVEHPDGERSTIVVQETASSDLPGEASSILAGDRVALQPSPKGSALILHRLRKK